MGYATLACRTAGKDIETDNSAIDNSTNDISFLYDYILADTAYIFDQYH
jgi:hypothetical protein